MGKIPENRWMGKLTHMVREISAMKVSLYAANSSYFLILSFFPALVLLMGMLRRTGLTAEVLVTLLDRVIPTALIEKARGLIDSIYGQSGGAVLGFSAVTAFWSASRGIHGLRMGLNAIYGVAETRSYWLSRGISLVYTLAFLLVLALTLVLHVFGSFLLKWLGGSWVILAKLVDARFWLLLGMQTLIFALIYTGVPSCRVRFRENLPGALLASLGWLVFSDVFSIYVRKFATLSNLYGSVYAVALTMLWLYWCMSILFYGGGVNRYLRSRKRK